MTSVALAQARGRDRAIALWHGHGTGGAVPCRDHFARALTNSLRLAPIAPLERCNENVACLIPSRDIHCLLPEDESKLTGAPYPLRLVLRTTQVHILRK